MHCKDERLAALAERLAAQEEVVAGKNREIQQVASDTVNLYTKVYFVSWRLVRWYDHEHVRSYFLVPNYRL